MRAAVLVKQVPRGEGLTIVDGRLKREGVDLEVNAYCRRANAKAVELAGDDGEVIVFTMGPPSADEALREMVACGATRAVHLCDPEFAGGDTLATARALALAVYAEGPFDLVLCGRNSIDADTGQVGPELAELLGLPFVGAARDLDLDGDRGEATVRSETDTGYHTVRVALPAVISTAERLCDPSKAEVDRRREVDGRLIERRSARSLGLRTGEVGSPGSPTAVGPARVLETSRARLMADSVAEAVDLLRLRGALEAGGNVAVEEVPEPGFGPIAIWCILDPDVDRPVRELLGEAATLASGVGGTVTAVVSSRPTQDLGVQGADAVLVVPGVHASDWAEAVSAAIGSSRPRIVLVEGTHTGREVASKVAARYGWGLTGDGIQVDVDDSGAMTVWKPALGGRLVVPITSSSEVQMATIRPGVLAVRRPRAARIVPVDVWSGPIRRPAQVEVVASERVDDGGAELAGARVVIGIGQGVPPEEYGEIEVLRRSLGASIGATRKVTDRGWMPRSRQIGITGVSISPRLFISICASGRFNHTSGFQAADHVLAVNSDPVAEIFRSADVGVVGEWLPVVRELSKAMGNEPVASTGLAQVAGHSPR